MKTKTIISEITHEDLVDFFSTALSGSNIFGVDYDTETYNKCPDKKEDDCIEDKLARILLNGGCITIYDIEAEDENDFYGQAHHSWDEDNETMDYLIDITDIKRGFQKCLDGTFNINDGCDEERGYIHRCMTHLIDGEGDLDLYEAQNILQVCVFNQMIYG